jgi:ABC-type transport system involved in cytochrome c biogenesis permease subunit
MSMAFEDWLAILAVLFLFGGGGLSLAGLLTGRPGLGHWARWCAGSGGYLLLLVLTWRGLQVQGWPLTDLYEVLLLTAATTALACALVAPRRQEALAGACAGPAAGLMVALALLFLPSGSRLPHPPTAALGSLWFPLHVLATTLGYGGLILAGSAGLLRLLPAGRLPISPHDAEEVAWRGLAWGYPWLTLGMVLGMVWGWWAWGRPWSWSTKEVLTLLTWGLFTLAFHTRRLKGWRGRPHALILTAGLAALLLTLLAAEALARLAVPVAEYVF